MTRRYTGKKPGAGWMPLGTVEAKNSWLVFVRPDPRSEWMSVKVAADGRVPLKANYWLGWNGSRFSRHADLALLLQRPDLAAAVEELLRTSEVSNALDVL